MFRGARYLLLSILGASLAAGAACQAVRDTASLPSQIKRDKCYELTDGVRITHGIDVAGKLHVRGRSRVEIAPGVEIRIEKGGELVNRGTLASEQGLSLRLLTYGKFVNEDSLALKGGAAVRMERGSSLVNKGDMLLLAGSLSLERDARLENGGTLSLEHSLVSLNFAAFESRGTLNCYQNTSLTASGSSRLVSRGPFNLLGGAALSLADSSVFSNFKQAVVEGELSLSNNASLKNKGIIRLNEGGSLVFNDGSSFNNGHIIDIKGALILGGHSFCENSWGLQIEQEGSLSLIEESQLINRGTMAVKGGISFASKGQIVNKNIIYSRDKTKITDIESLRDLNR